MLDRGDDAVAGLNGFSEYVKMGNEYVFDANGNLTTDANKGYTSILYNYMNLPRRVGTTGQYISYIYSADGTKLAKVGTNSVVTTYAGSFVYEGSSLKYMMHPEGMYLPGGNYQYYLKDHLGNTRLVVNTSGVGGTVVQQTDYYPFGMDIASFNGGVDNRYRYNGKELQTDDIGGKKLDWYDYGARFYDPALGRWHSVDPMAEDYYDLSPYSYCAGNPIACRDENGEWINFVIGAAVGAITDYAVQVATNVASGQDFGDAMTNVSGKSIGLAASAGALGVGIASGFSKLATVGKLATIASKSETAATFVKAAANVAGDATASVAGSVVQGKNVTVKGVVADVIGGAVAKKIETNVKTSAQNSPAGKTLQNQADRAQRIASNPKQSRVDNAKAATTKANNYGATKAFAAGTAGGNATSKAVEAAITVVTPKEEIR